MCCCPSSTPIFVWVWPPENQAHDPLHCETVLGRFDAKRWKRFYADFLARHVLIHDQHDIQRIQLTHEKDGAFAVVDIDMLWQDQIGNDIHWLGRVCKV